MMENIWGPLELELKTRFGFNICDYAITCPLIVYESMPEDLVKLTIQCKGGTKYAMGFPGIIKPKELVNKIIGTYLRFFHKVEDRAFKIGIAPEKGIKTKQKELKNIIYFMQREEDCNDQLDIQILNALKANINELSQGELVNLLLLSEKDSRTEISSRQTEYHEILLGNLKLPELTVSLSEVY